MAHLLPNRAVTEHFGPPQTPYRGTAPYSQEFRPICVLKCGRMRCNLLRSHHTVNVTPPVTNAGSVRDESLREALHCVCGICAVFICVSLESEGARFKREDLFFTFFFFFYKITH